jgi:hypothetical protein
MKKDLRKAIQYIIKEVRFKSGDKQSRLYVFLDDSGQCRIYFSIDGESPVSVWGREDLSFINIQGFDKLRPVDISTMLNNMGFEDKTDHIRGTWGDISIHKRIIEFIDVPSVNKVSPEMVKRYTNVVSTS